MKQLQLKSILEKNYSWKIFLAINSNSVYVCLYCKSKISEYTRDHISNKSAKNINNIGFLFIWFFSVCFWASMDLSSGYINKRKNEINVLIRNLQSNCFQSLDKISAVLWCGWVVFQGSFCFGGFLFPGTPTYLFLSSFQFLCSLRITSNQYTSNTLAFASTVKS